MGDAVFRDCRESDLPQVRLFVKQMYSEDADAHSGQPDTDLTFAEFARKPDKGRLIVFERDGALAGYAILIFFWSNEFRGNIIDIDELYVAPESRGGGLARQFFAWLRSTYKRDSVGWSLQVSFTNARAQKLYNHLGFTASMNQHMIKVFAADE